MSCGKHHGRHENCVCDAVEQIIKEQDAVEETTACSTSCFGNLLSPTVSGKDTIPFLLYDKKGGLFSTFGNVGGFSDDMQCFESIFFRAESLKDCCATLSILRPPVNNRAQGEPLMEIYLLRHGIAEDGSPDSARALTAEGKEKLPPRSETHRWSSRH